MLLDIGDTVIYNGRIIIRDDFVIKADYTMINLGNKYVINDIIERDNEYYYEIYADTNWSWCFPIECFHINNNYMKTKYGLK